MLYLLVFLFPPLACLGAGKFWHFILNLCICCTIVGIPIAMIHAWYVVKGSEERGGRHGNVIVNVGNYNDDAPRRRRRR